MILASLQSELHGHQAYIAFIVFMLGLSTAAATAMALTMIKDARRRRLNRPWYLRIESGFLPLITRRKAA